jgi:hypothetical protein
MDMQRNETITDMTNDNSKGQKRGIDDVDYEDINEDEPYGKFYKEGETETDDVEVNETVDMEVEKKSQRKGF